METIAGLIIVGFLVWAVLCGVRVAGDKLLNITPAEREQIQQRIAARQLALARLDDKRRARILARAIHNKEIEDAKIKKCQEEFNGLVEIELTYLRAENKD